MKGIGLINLSAVPNDEMEIIARALKLYMVDVCTPWDRAPIDVKFFKGETVAPIGYAPLVLFANVDQPGAGYAGYHDVDELGRPFGRAFHDTVPNGTVLHDPSGKGASVAALLSHEAGEMGIDPGADTYTTGPYIDIASEKAYMPALETNDPVQEVAYTIDVDGQKVDVSDFVFPAWFDRHAKGEQFDKCRVLTVPLSLAPGGYVIVREAKADRQFFARLLGRKPRPKVRKLYHPTPPAEWREKAKRGPGGRTKRRLAG